MKRLGVNRLAGFRASMPPVPAGVVALAILGTALILLREVHYGVGMANDGVGYVLRAQRILAGPGWLVHLSGTQAPLYPFLLAFAGLPGFDLMHVAGVMNATAFGLTILFAGLHLNDRLASRPLAIWATAAVMLSIPLTTAASNSATEPVFILFTLLALIDAERFLTRQARSALVRAAVFSSAACLTRYNGGAVIPVVALLLLFGSDAALRDRFRQAAAYSLVAAAPICLFLLRNFLLAGSITWRPAHTMAPDVPLTANLRAFAEALASWALPVFDASNPPAGMQGALTAAPILLLLASMTAGCLSARSIAKSGGRIAPAPKPLAPFAGYAAAQISLLVVVAIVENMETSNADRYLSPVYVPLVIAVSLAADRLLSPAPSAQRGGRSLRAVLIASMFLWLHYPALENARAAAVHLEQGVGHTSAQWRDCSVMRYLERNRVDDPVHTNKPEWVDLSLGLRTTQLFNFDQLMSEIRRQPPTHVVRIDHRYDYRWLLARRPSFEGLPEVETLFSAAEGGVWRFALRGRNSLDEIMKTTEPVIRSDYYDVYLDGDRLIYVRNGSAEDDEAGLRFFLHVVPTETENLHWARKWLGRRQFDWGESCTWRSGGRCAVVAGLPDYSIASFSTGQYLAGANKTYGDLTYARSLEVVWNFAASGRFAIEDHLWEGEFSFDRAEDG